MVKDFRKIRQKSCMKRCKEMRVAKYIYFKSVRKYEALKMLTTFQLLYKSIFFNFFINRHYHFAAFDKMKMQILRIYYTIIA